MYYLVKINQIDGKVDFEFRDSFNTIEEFIERIDNLHELPYFEGNLATKLSVGLDVMGGILDLKSGLKLINPNHKENEPTNSKEDQRLEPFRVKLRNSIIDKIIGDET